MVGGCTAWGCIGMGFGGEIFTGGKVSSINGGDKTDATPSDGCDGGICVYPGLYIAPPMS